MREISIKVSGVKMRAAIEAVGNITNRIAEEGGDEMAIACSMCGVYANVESYAQRMGDVAAVKLLHDIEADLVAHIMESARGETKQ